MNVADTSTTRHANVMRNSGSWGNIFGVFVANDGNVHWNCGMTFISEHMAITAAHCVEGYGVGGIVPAARVTTTNLQATAVNNRGTVSGTWDNWSSGPLMTGSHGYAQEEYWCWVIYRCSYPNPGNCPSGAQGHDVAMLSCQRPTPKDWVPVRSDDPKSGDVEMYWFHEVLRLQRWQNDSTYDSPTNNWENYGGVTDYPDNYHYTNATGHQYLLIRSATWPNGTNYKITEWDSAGFTRTDLTACRGTSGGGVFRTSSTALVGPAVKSTTGHNLCSNWQAASPGGKYTTHVNAPVVRVLEQLSVVQEDR